MKRFKWLRFRSLRNYILAGLLFNLLGVFGAFLALSLYSSYQILKTNATESLATEVANAQLALRQSVWALDDAATAEIVEGFFQDPDVIAVRVFDDSHKKFVVKFRQGWNESDLTSIKNSTRLLSKSAPINNDGKRIGDVEIFEDIQTVKDSMWILGTKLFLTMGLILVTVFFALYRVLQKGIVEPLLKLGLLSKSIATGNYQRRADAMPHSELNTLAKSLNSMIRAIQERDAKLIAHSESLEQTVAERTQQLEVQQFKALQSARLVAVGEMSASMAHEINNPLGVIHGKTNFLLGMIEDKTCTIEKVETDLKKISLMSERIAKIVKSLLLHARNGNADSFEYVSFKKIVEGVSDLCLPSLSGLGINLIVEGFEDCQCLCREVQISQVLLNLINNARDAIVNQEDKWIKVSVKDHQESLEIRITDSGPGIAPEIRSKIMEPFFTTKAAHKGTGLGLSISKNIIEAHQGTLAYDAESKTTCFVVMLPKSPALSANAA